MFLYVDSIRLLAPMGGGTTSSSGQYSQPTDDRTGAEPSEAERIAALESRLDERERELAEARAEIAALESTVEAKDAQLSAVIDRYETVVEDRKRHRNDKRASTARRTVVDRLRSVVPDLSRSR